MGKTIIITNNDNSQYKEQFQCPRKFMFKDLFFPYSIPYNCSMMWVWRLISCYVKRTDVFPMILFHLNPRLWLQKVSGSSQKKIKNSCMQVYDWIVFSTLSILSRLQRLSLQYVPEVSCIYVSDELCSRKSPMLSFLPSFCKWFNPPSISEGELGRNKLCKSVSMEIGSDGSRGSLYIRPA